MDPFACLGAIFCFVIVSTMRAQLAASLFKIVTHPSSHSSRERGLSPALARGSYERVTIRFKKASDIVVLGIGGALMEALAAWV